MPHNGDSKIESLNLRIDKGLADFLTLLADKNPKSELCKTKIGYTFMIYGLVTAFGEDIEYDLSNLEWVIKNLKKTENKINGIINRVNSNLKNE